MLSVLSGWLHNMDVGFLMLIKIFLVSCILDRLIWCYMSSISYCIAEDSFSVLLMQKNKWEFFMFLALEVSAMIITGLVTLISM